MKRTISLCLWIMMLTFVSFAKSPNQVVLYTSLDQIYSEPIVKDFEKKTGIQVKVVYDSEATKTVGLVNRLIAEKSNPQADVFWNSEVGRTIVLKNKGILTPYRSPQAKTIPATFKDGQSYWTGFAARARVMVYNTKMVKKADLPKTLSDLTNPKWKGKFVMADPLFGSTGTHFAALYTVWGEQKTRAFCRALKANHVVLVNGNSVVRDKVGAGDYPIGITDTDDAMSGKLSGMPIELYYLDQGQDGLGTFVMPNTVALIKDGPNQKNAKKLIDYLLSPEVEKALAQCESRQIPLHQGLKVNDGITIDNINAMKVNFVAVGNKLESSGRFLQKLFKQ